MKDNKKTIQILVILTIIFSVMGGSLAYWNWSSESGQKTNIVFTVEKDFSCAADGGGNISHADVSLAPTTCTDVSRAIKRKVTVTPTLDRDNLTVSLDLWLNINELGDGLKKSNNFRYVLTTSGNSCEEGEIISEGNFKGRKPGDKIRLITNDLHTVTPTPEEYYLYIWLDAAETNSNTMNQRFSMSLGGVCDEVETLVGDAYAIVTSKSEEECELVDDGYEDDDGNWIEDWVEYCEEETPNVLRFVRSDTPINVGDTYNDFEVTAVYSGIEEDSYTKGNVPWKGEPYLDKIVFEDTIRPKSTAYWFYNFDVSDNSIDITKLDTSQVTDMESMFFWPGDSRPFYNELSINGLENLDVSKVTDMSEMFSGLHLTNDLNLSSWDTSNVTDMSFMFHDSDANSILGLDNWDVSNVSDMSYMFSFGDLFENFDLSNWNVSNVTNMQDMFDFEGTIDSNLGIENWDVSSVTDMHEMFGEVYIVNIDLSNWDTSNVTDMSYMFYFSEIVGDLNISNWNTSNVTDMQEMFLGVTLDTTIDLRSWDVSKVKNFDYFRDSDNDKLIPPNFG